MREGPVDRPGVTHGHVREHVVRAELRHLRAFVAVAEELSFTRAAQRLFLAQQALSLQIGQLENLMAVRLFERTTRRVQLTPAGQALLDHVPAALAQLDTAWRAAVEADAQPSCNIGYSSFIPFLAELAGAVLEEAPGAELSIRETWCDEAVDAVRRGTLDVAYVWSPPEDDPGLVVSVVRTTRLGVILGTRHPLAHQAVVEARELHKSKLMIMPRPFFPRLHDVASSLFPTHAARGLLEAYRNVTRGGFLDDPVAEREVSSGAAFCLNAMSVTPPRGYVSRPLEPEMSLGMYVVHRPVATGESSAAQEPLVEKLIRLSQPSGCAFAGAEAGFGPGLQAQMSRV